MIAVPLALIFGVWIAVPTSITGKRMISTKRGMDDWKPVGYGNPMSNDPTLVYVPPVLDPVHYGIHTLEPMWPIRSLNRLQTGNHNGKLRPTLLTPPEGAGHFQNVMRTGESIRMAMGGPNYIRTLPHKTSASIKSQQSSLIRNEDEDSGHKPTTHSSSSQLMKQPIALCCFDEQEMKSRQHSQVVDDSLQGIHGSVTKDVAHSELKYRKKPRFQLVQQVRSRVRMYGAHSGKLKQR